MRILWLKTELLHPVDKGGRIRTYQMLRELKREHHVTYLALDDGTAAADAAERATEYCHELVRVPFRRSANFSPRFWLELAANAASPLPYTIARYRSRAFHAALEAQVRDGDYDVVVCDFLTPAINVPAALPCPVVLFQHNVEAAIWERHFRVAANPLRKAYMYLEWQKLQRFERRACRRFDHVVAVSAEDRETFRSAYGVDASDVPTGVDTAFFRRRGEALSKPNHLVFTGSMDWLPNVDGIRHFVADVLPRVKEYVPDASLTIVGRDPLPEITALGRGRDDVVVTGRVDDVRPYIEEAALFIVPLRIGGGTRLKIYEAMAMECPVVSTTIGAEGLPLADGREIVLADGADAFADAIIELLGDEPRRAAIARDGAAVVRQRFGWAQAAQAFAAICEAQTAGETAPRG